MLCLHVVLQFLSFEFLPSEAIGKMNKYNSRKPISIKFIRKLRKWSGRICLYEMTKSFIDLQGVGNILAVTNSTKSNTFL